MEEVKLNELNDLIKCKMDGLLIYFICFLLPYICISVYSCYFYILETMYIGLFFLSIFVKNDGEPIKIFFKYRFIIYIPIEIISSCVIQINRNNVYIFYIILFYLLSHNKTLLSDPYFRYLKVYLTRCQMILKCILAMVSFENDNFFSLIDCLITTCIAVIVIHVIFLFIETNEINSKSFNKIKFSLDNKTKLLNVIYNAPIGLFVFKKFLYIEEKENMTLVFTNQAAEKIFDIKTDMRIEEIKRKLGVFQNFNFKQSKKRFNFEKNLYNDILKSPPLIDNEFCTIEKYINNEQLILVKSRDYVFCNNYIMENYTVHIVENLLEEKKQIQSNLYKNVKTQFLNTISHELNNPLNGLIYSCQNILENNHNGKNKTDLLKIKRHKFFIKLFISTLTLSFRLNFKEKMTPKPLNIDFNFFFLKLLTKFELFYSSKKITFEKILDKSEGIIIFYDYEHVKYLFKVVLLYISYKLEKNNSFLIQTYIDLQTKQIKLNFIKKQSSILRVRDRMKTIKKNCAENIDISFSEELSIENSVQTIEMLKDIILSLKEYLNFTVDLNEEILSLSLNFVDNIEQVSSGCSSIEEFTQEMKVAKEVASRELVRKGASSNLLVRIESSIHMPEVNRRISLDEDALKSVKYGILPQVTFNAENFVNDRKLSSASSMEFEFKQLINKQPSHTNVAVYKNSYINNIFNVKKEKRNSRLGIDVKFISSQLNTINDQSEFIEYQVSERPCDSIISYSDKQHSLKRPLDKSVSKTTVDGFRPFKNTSKRKVVEKTRTVKINKNFLLDQSVDLERVIQCKCSKVLLVDDEPFIISTMKKILKGFNIESDSASDGQEAFNKVENDFNKTCCQSFYRLIFMDIMMPNMDGVEASKQIQHLALAHKQSELSIIIVSANNENLIHSQLTHISFVKRMLSKPVRKVKVEELLNEYLLWKK
jgi:CheY-like chemotaxis protein